jgi:probable rRNA maturation factor
LFVTVRIDVVKAVAAPFRPGDLRAVLGAAAAVREVGARLGDEPSLVVRVTGDRELRRLNRRFLGEDHATDVLAFPSGQPSGHVGDIAISWPAVRRQAAEHGHAEFTELGLLAVHGFLHLLGWDHAAAAQRREMTRLTLAALELAGLKLAPGRL